MFKRTQTDWVNKIHITKTQTTDITGDERGRKYSLLNREGIHMEFRDKFLVDEIFGKNKEREVEVNRM